MKRLVSILLALTMISSCLALAGCDWSNIFNPPSTSTSKDPLAPLKDQIVEDYLIYSGIQSDKKPEEIEYEFLGQYGDSAAVYFHTAGAYETPVKETIGGIAFNYPDSRVIRIWSNGKFYKMSEAYEMGLITREDVLSIKLKSFFVKYKEPYFIYEEKEYFEFDYTDPDLLCYGFDIYLDKGISSPNKIIDKKFFADIPIEEIYINYFSSTDTLSCIITFPEVTPEQLEELYHILMNIDGVRTVYVGYKFKWDYKANDPYYTNSEEYGQWALDTIEIDKVWDFTIGSSGVRVGIIDTGIAFHEDLNDNYFLSNAWAFGYEPTDYIENIKADYEGHGTHVAGIIGAVGNNNIGVTGVNWDVSLVQLKTVSGFAMNNTVFKAFDWAISKMNTTERIPIINMSISWDDDYNDLEERVRNYTNSGGLLICSIGNEEENSDVTHKYPGFYGSVLYGENKIDNIITVGNIDINNSLPEDSNWGKNTIDIYAPGENILSTIPCELCASVSEYCSLEKGHVYYGYHSYSGSSMSTPYVTGVAALLLSVNPNLTAAQLKECILNGADSITITTGDGEKQSVRKLNAWGAFIYLMTHYPLFERTIGYRDVLYTYSIDADADYMKDNTSMMKFIVANEGEYTFKVSANDSINVKFYDSEFNEITVTQTNTDDNNEIEFIVTLSNGIYHIRTNYSNSISSGTVSVNIDCPPHTHIYNGWSTYSPLFHIEKCECGATGTRKNPHAVRLSDPIVNGCRPCMSCGYPVPTDSGPTQIIHNIQKISINGSYILPNGIIVLVDEDVEAYMNGTLVFYDKDKLPELQ